jgi:hypothetical protein
VVVGVILVLVLVLVVVLIVVVLVVVVVDALGFEADELTTAVAPDVATADPFLFVAVTVTRNVCPTSAELSTYALFAADVIAEHAAPELSQRCHWNPKVGLGPDQTPGSAEGVWPWAAVPLIEGGVVFVGAVCPGGVDPGGVEAGPFPFPPEAFAAKSGSKRSIKRDHARRLRIAGPSEVGRPGATLGRGKGIPRTRDSIDQGFS